MKVFKLFGKIVATVFAFLTLGLGLLTLANHTSAQAEVKYLTVKQSDFTVESFKKIGEYYLIILKYSGENESGLPHESAQIYQERNTSLDTDDNEKLNLYYLYSANSSPYSLGMYINLTYSSDGKIGYTAANPTEIRIPNGSRFTSSISYEGEKKEYGGIYFENGLRLVYNADTKAWECVIDGAETTLTSHSVTLDKTNVTKMGINESSGLLEATLALPYAHTDTVEYEGTFSATVSGIEYTGEISAYHVANTQTLLLVFNGSEHIGQTPQGVSVTLLGGELISAEIGVKLTVDGEITFYGYSDKTFSTEEYIEIHKTIAGVKSMEKVLASEETYVLQDVAATEGKLFWGWKLDGQEYQNGDTLTLSEYKNTGVHLEAVFLEYGLLSGATIRCDKDLTSSGIRFSADLSETDYLAHKSVIRGVGIILIPSDLIQDKPFILKNYSGENGAKNFYAEASAITFDEKGIFRLHATLSTILESNYNREFSARAYMLVNRNGAEEYLWGTQIESRSVYDVATKALKNHKTDNDLTATQFKILQAYVNGVANVTYDNETANIVCEAETPAISAVEVRKNGTTVTLVLTTAKERFAAILYNGKRIRGAEQTYTNGTLIVTFTEEE